MQKPKDYRGYVVCRVYATRHFQSIARFVSDNWTLLSKICIEIKLTTVVSNCYRIRRLIVAAPATYLAFRFQGLLGNRFN